MYIMSNDTITTKVGRLMALAKQLPIFSFNDLLSVEKDRAYLKIFLSRYAKKGKILRLKKGLYVSADYVLEMRLAGRLSEYVEFVAITLESPSYLSLDYVLYEHGLLTEIPTNVTAITLAKPMSFVNGLGNFIYHKIKPSLFVGFNLTKKGKFYLARATKVKALFDWLYLRKNSLLDKTAVAELRLNWNNMKTTDWRELERYCKLEGTMKMKNIFKMLSSYGNY